MNDKKKDVINNSSLIDLKAELLRKQQQFRKDKAGNASFVKAKSKEKKTDIWSKSNAGVRERSQRDLEAKQEEENAMAKSRKMLEKKAKLYESMTSGKSISEEDGSKVFLVDFEQKSISKISEDRDRQRDEDERRAELEETEARKRADQEDVRKLFLNEQVTEPEDEGEEWVDYTDSLGRSRRCMKKDLPELLEMDRNLTNKKDPDEKCSDTEPDLMSADMYRERLREKWEKEEREAMEGPVGPLHYANVQYDEVRTHGVGFFQFDKTGTVREEQLDELNKLREETKDKRAAHKSLKEKRKAMVAARLAKVRQRKAIREGKDPVEALQANLNSDDSDEDLIGPKIEEKEPEPLKRDESWRKDAPVREWDKGKEDLEDFIGGRNTKSETQWMEKLRKQRNAEFAPPSIYKTDHKASSTKQTSKLTIGKKTWSNPMETFDEIRNDPGGHVDRNPRFNQPNQTNWKSGAQVQPNTSVGTSQRGTNMTWNSSTNIQSGQGIYDYIGSTLSALRAQVDGKQQNITGKSAPQSTSTKPSSTSDLSNIPLPPSMPVQTTSGVSLSSDSRSKPDVVVKAPVVEQDTHKPAQDTLVQSNPCTDALQPAHIIATSAQIYTKPSLQHTSSQQTVNTEQTSKSAGILSTGTKREHDSAGVTEVYGNTSTTVSSQDEPAGASQSSSEPQPAHYASGPTKPQPKKPRYERINLHELPATLPAPPTANNVPEYPSQEEIFGPQPKTDKKPLSEEQAVKQWQRQFDGGNKSLKPANIPFASPYIKNSNQDDSTDNDPAVEFDPAKPPPSISK